MIYIYRRAPSDSARALVVALNGKRARRLTVLKRCIHPKSDYVVCWGDRVTAPGKIRVINNAPLSGKMEQIEDLTGANVPTVTAQYTAPNDIDGWLPRLSNHVGGQDLLFPVANPDFWVKKEDLMKEYRIHWFNGRSIRAGVKVPREGVAPHLWIRSFDAGWRVVYDGFKSTPAQRRLAKKAIKALELQFGAVDIGEKEDGQLIVLEVNRAPGCDPNTTLAYARAIKEWAGILPEIDVS